MEHPSSPRKSMHASIPKSMHAHVHRVTAGCSALAGVCGRGLTAQAAPAPASGLLSFSRSKRPKASLPFKPLEGRWYVLRQMWW